MQSLKIEMRNENKKTESVCLPYFYRQKNREKRESKCGIEIWPKKNVRASWRLKITETCMLRKRRWKFGAEMVAVGSEYGIGERQVRHCCVRWLWQKNFKFLYCCFAGPTLLNVAFIWNLILFHVKISLHFYLLTNILF